MFFKQEIIDKLIEISTQAGKIIKENYLKTANVTYKEDSTPLTKTDILSHDYLVSELTKLIPGIPIISEESSYIAFKERKKWKEYWLIDPLDGTRGFIDKTDDFCTCIAYIKNNTPVFGMIFIPMRQACYYANDSKVAYKLQNNELKQISVSKPKVPLRVVVGRYSIARPSIIQHLKYTQNGRYKINGIGSAIKFCLIAEGKFDYYPGIGICSEWDTAAGGFILQAAGGSIVDQENNPMRYNTKNDLLSSMFFAAGAEPLSRTE
ncbi:MAG: 3'(2'),5'-bisphosphate nucleotidase CysQ [Candidatus Thioglobus sp.]|nr:3'(2'),5'-bisphosphate nucleotidase CysQ [Candidatus Thioglobus sp.]